MYVCYLALKESLQPGYACIGGQTALAYQAGSVTRSMHAQLHVVHVHESGDPYMSGLGRLIFAYTDGSVIKFAVLLGSSLVSICCNYIRRALRHFKGHIVCTLSAGLLPCIINACLKSSYSAHLDMSVLHFCNVEFCFKVLV